MKTTKSAQQNLATDHRTQELMALVKFKMNLKNSKTNLSFQKDACHKRNLMSFVDNCKCLNSKPIRVLVMYKNCDRYIQDILANLDMCTFQCLRTYLKYIISSCNIFFNIFNLHVAEDYTCGQILRGTSI